MKMCGHSKDSHSNFISAPTAKQEARTMWMDYDEFFDADPITGIMWHDDAPEEALESFELWQADNAQIMKA